MAQKRMPIITAPAIIGGKAEGPEPSKNEADGSAEQRQAE
jgi:hypothetical protein